MLVRRPDSGYGGAGCDDDGDVVAKGIAPTVQRVHLHPLSVSAGETWAATAATVLQNTADHAIPVSAGDTSAVPGATAEERSVTRDVLTKYALICLSSTRRCSGRGLYHGGRSDNHDRE